MNGYMMIYLKNDGSYGFTFFAQPISSFVFEESDLPDVAAFMFMLKYPEFQLVGVLEMDYSEFKQFKGKTLDDWDPDACVLKFRCDPCG